MHEFLPFAGIKHSNQKSSMFYKLWLISYMVSGSLFRIVSIGWYLVATLWYYYFLKNHLRPWHTVGLRTDGVVGRAALPSLSTALKCLAWKCSPKPLNCLEISGLKMATEKSEALPSRSGSVVRFQGPPGAYWAVATQNSGGLISVQQTTIADVARASLASVCLFNHASFSTKMTLGCSGKLICIALPRRERAAGPQPMGLLGSVCW